MKITPYNKDVAIEAMLAHMLLFFMGEHRAPVGELGEHGSAMWEMCSGMSEAAAADAIAAFNATQ